MENATDRVLDKVRRRRTRGWLEVAIGIALVGASAVAGIWGRELLGTKLWYGATALPAVAGFITLVHGILQLLDVHAGLVKPVHGSAQRTDLTVAFGFRSFVAWRYLMARHHRVSRVVLIFFMSALFVAFAAAIAERMVLTKANPLGLEPEVLIAIARIVTGIKIFAYVLLFFTIVIAGLRYVFSFFTTVPLVGVWIGTGALICVLSVMSGFETDLRVKILGSNAHIQITREDGEAIKGDEWRDVKARVDKVSGVVASSPYAVSEVVIASNSNGQNVIIKGIDPATVGKVTDLVHDIDDPDKAAVMKRLEPLIDDTPKLVVPPHPAPASGTVVDPPPANMPDRGDPIDFSQPKPEPPDATGSAAGSGGHAALDPDQPPPIDDLDDEGSAGTNAKAGSDKAGSDKAGSDKAGSDKVGDKAGSDKAGSDKVGDKAGSDKAGTDKTGDKAGSDFGGDAAAIVADAGPPVDPPPANLLHTDEPPIDYSGQTEVPIKVVDIDQNAMSRRTQSLHGILVGRELVHQTHLYTGEEVRVVSPLSDPANPDATGTPIPFHRDYRVAGIFYTGMYEYDLKYVYVTLDSLTEFLARGDVVDGIEVRIKDADDTDRYIGRLQTLLGKQYRIQDWKELNRSLFSALKLEKIAMFLVLGIVILVASFSIVGNLIMVVVEKAREIALLKTLGASDPNIMLIFAIQGLLIGVIGTALGVGVGLAACYFGKTYGIPLNPDVYYIDRMPVHVDESSVVITAIAGVFISMAATFYPALLAARVRPAAGMRH